MIKATVNVQRDWGDELIKRANRVAKEAVADASESGARTASSIASRRSRTGKMADMEVLEVVGTGTGWTGGFRSKAWYAGFQSRGTQGSRKGRVSASTLRRRQSASGQARSARGSGKGISPLGFLEAGAREAKKELKLELERRMGTSRR